MINALLPPLTDLDEETRLELANYLRGRNEYLEATRTLNELRIQMLIDGTPESAERASDYASTVVGPLRDGLTPRLIGLLKKSVDFESLKGMLPMVVMGLMRSVNLRLMLTTIGYEPDVIDKLVNMIKDYVSRD